MARFRAALGVGMLGASAMIAFAVANCASPTQIIVDVRADQTVCRTLLSGIAVTKLSNIDTDPLEVYEKGCEPGSDEVGTLTIVPSGSEDDWVGIRLVGGVNGKDPDLCGLPGTDGKPVWTDCVLMRRRVQFVSGKTVNLTVRLTTECVGRYCGGELECNLGVCVQPTQVQPDGGNTPPTKDGDLPIDDVFVPDVKDAGLPVDTDACARCTGTSCVGDLCTYDCTGAACSEKTLCDNGLDCVIECGQGESCRRTQCRTDRSCTFNCSGSQDRCDDIACASGTCNVNCRSNAGVCKGVHLDGGANNVNCVPANDSPTCNDVRCHAGTCKRECNDGGCGPDNVCTGGCGAWDDGGPQQ